LRRRTVALPVAASASPTQCGSIARPKTSKLSARSPLPNVNSARPRSIEAPLSISWPPRSGGAADGPSARPSRLPTSPPDQVAIDRGQLLDRRPPGAVVGDPALGDRDQPSRQRDLLGAPAGERHAQVGGGMSLALGAVAARLAAAQRAHDDAAPEDLLEGRELREDPATTREQAPHFLRLNRRKTIPPQPRGEAHAQRYELTR